jgi:hypothetical protein
MAQPARLAINDESRPGGYPVELWPLLTMPVS